jgi:hypothetical protein
MRKLVMLALLVAALMPAGATLAAAPPPAPLPETPQSADGTGTVVPVDPPPFVVIDGILWKFKGPIGDHAGWLRMKVTSSSAGELVGRKIKVKLPPQVLVSFTQGADRLHLETVRVWVPRSSHGLVASAIELG